MHHTDISLAYKAEQLDIVDGNHRNRGYDESSLGYNVCYDVFIGSTGRIVQTRPLTDRTKCTSNNEINMKAVQVVVAGSFGKDEPTKEQIQSLLSVILQLQEQYHIPDENVIGHQEASPTSCPGKNIMKILHEKF